MSTNRTDALLIARRYATAIFAQAVADKQETAVVSEFETLAKATVDSKELAAALANPLVTRAEKSNVLAALTAKASPLTNRAVKTLATGGRSELIPYVAQILKQKLDAQNGEVVAVVTSARPLGDATQKQLQTALAKATGKKVQLQLTQNPDVLGGLSVQLGSLRLDATLAGALNSMKSQMNAASSTQI